MTNTAPALRNCPKCHGNGWVGHGPYRAETPCPYGHADEIAAIRAEAAARPSAQDIARARLAARRAAR